MGCLTYSRRHMKKLIFFLIFALCLPFVLAEEAKLLQLVEAPEPLIDYIENKVSIKTPMATIDLDRLEAKSNEDVKLLISESKTEFTQLCFEFPVPLEKIKINKIEQKGVLFFNTDLKENEAIVKNEDNKICYSGSFNNEEIIFKAEYLANSEHRIKYNITFENNEQKIVLDPYLIGSLATSNSLLLRLPFDGNINQSYGMITSSITSSSLKYNATGQEQSCSGTCTNWEFAFDNNFATYISESNTESTIYMSFPKLTNDTGMIIQNKFAAGPSGYGTTLYGCDYTGVITSNFSITDNCFNAYSSKVSIYLYQRTWLYSDFAHTYYNLYCYDGSSWQNIYSCEGYRQAVDSHYPTSTALTYELGAWITNQSGYTAYYPALINTTYTLGDTSILKLRMDGNISDSSSSNVKTSYYVNVSSMIAGYDFRINQNANDLTGNGRTGYNTNTNYETNGIIYNGVNSYTNLTTYSMNENFTLYARFKWNGSTGDNTIFDANNFQAGNGTGYGVYLNGGVIYFGLGNGTSGLVSTGNIVTANVYHNLVVKRSNTEIEIWLNGINRTFSLSGSNLFKDNGMKMYIGAYSANSDVPNGGYFNGTISTVLIYNKTLTTNDITKLMQQYSNATDSLAQDNRAMNLSGDSYIVLDNVTSLSSVPKSISLWFKPKSLPQGSLGSINGAGLFSKTTNEYEAFMNNNTIRLRLNGATFTKSSGVNFETSHGFQNNIWYHIVYVFNGSNAYYYVNGILNDSDTYTGSMSGSTNQLMIGKRNGQPDSFFNGTIDEVNIFNTALTQSDVTTLYNKGVNYTTSLTPIFAKNKLGENNSSLNLTGDAYVLTTNISTVTSTSFWYKNSTGSWTHIVNNSNTYYCNNVLCSKPADYPVSIQSNKVYVGQGFTGLIDELLFYNYALSSSEIYSLAHGYDADNVSNVYLYDESDGGLLDMTGKTITAYYYYYNGSISTQTISNNNFLAYFDSTQLKKVRFIVEQNGENYYRTLLTQDFNFSSNQNASVYLLDLNSSTVIFNTFQLFALTSSYPNARLYLQRNINGVTQTMTSDIFNVETKIGAYLLQNAEYQMILCTDDPNVCKNLGSYDAISAGDKVIKYYDLKLENEPTQLYNHTSWSTLNNESGINRIETTYIGYNTSTATYTVKLSNSTGTLLYNATLTSDVGQFLYNVPEEYENSSFFINTSITDRSGNKYDLIKIISSKGRQLGNIFDELLGEYISPTWWKNMLGILLSVIALIFTTATASLGGLIFAGFAAFFFWLGWLPLSAVALGLAIALSVANALKHAGGK